MSDNLRRYRALCHALTHAYPTPPPGHFARHVQTLAALLSGIGGRTSTPRPPSATTVPAGPKPESRVQRFTRGVDHERIVEAMDFFPSAERCWTPRALEPLGLVREGSVVGRGGAALMIHVRSTGRALPLAWRVRQGPQGPVPAALHSAGVEWIRAGSPEGATVVLLGDGACDGTALQATLNEAGWSYACRTALRTVATWKGEPFRLDTLGAWSKPGTRIALPEVQWTRDAYGPVMVRSGWAKGYQAPLSVVSHRDTAEEACPYSQKRFRIETFVSDQKSRGFHLHTQN